MKNSTIGRWGMGLIACAVLPAAQAFKFDVDDYKISFDSTLSYGLQLRTQNRNCHIIAIDNGGCASLGAELPEASGDAYFINADDGDLNYNKGDVVSQAFKGTHELSVKSGYGLSLFGRFTELYDVSAGHTERTPLADDAKDIAVANFTLLDLYASQDFELFDRRMRLRVGNQVLSWGESTFILAGINYTNAIDVRRAHVPGTQLKEIYRPAPMVLWSGDIDSGLSFETYYQWRWNNFLLDPPGTYFSSADVVGKGNTRALFIPTSNINGGLRTNPATAALLATGLIHEAPPGTVGDPGGTGLTSQQLADPNYVSPRIASGIGFNGAVLNPVGTAAVNALLGTGTAIPLDSDSGPGNSGQYGASLRYKPEWISADFGAYYLHYSEKLPFITYVVDAAKYGTSNPLAAGYRIEYPRNRSLYGVSTNFNAGDFAVGSELSYRPKEAVMIDPSVPTGADPKSAKYACLQDATAGTFGTAKTGEQNGKYCKGWVDQQKYQAQTTFLQVLSQSDGIGAWLLPLTGASEGVFLTEIGATYFPNLDPLGGIPWSLPAYSLPSKLSAGYVTEVSINYPNALFGFTLSPQIDWSQGVAGNSPNSLPWQSGVKAGTFTLNFNRRNRIVGLINYSWFWGGGSKNLTSDRDFLGFAIGYNF